jgi:hypothetical protein
MNIKEFKSKAEDLLGQLETLIQTMPQKGDKSTDCQRIYLQQQINEVYYAINGTEQSDLNDEVEEEEIDLFEDFDNLPSDVQAVIMKFEDSEQDYNTCQELVDALEEVGYTCEYGLTAVPYNLKKIENSLVD